MITECRARRLEDKHQTTEQTDLPLGGFAIRAPLRFRLRNRQRRGGVTGDPLDQNSISELLIPTNGAKRAVENSIRLFIFILALAQVGEAENRSSQRHDCDEKSGPFRLSGPEHKKRKSNQRSA